LSVTFTDWDFKLFTFIFRKNEMFLQSLWMDHSEKYGETAQMISLVDINCDVPAQTAAVLGNNRIFAYGTGFETGRVAVGQRFIVAPKRLT
jgi:hypothetical protein